MTDGQHLVEHKPNYRLPDLYEAVVSALGEAKTIVETMDARNKAETLEFLARQSKDTEAIARAVELRFLSERKLGGVIAGMKARGELFMGGRSLRPDQTQQIRLADVGIDHKLSSQAQRLHDYDEDRFGQVLSDALHRIRGGRAIVVNPAKDLKAADKKLRREIRLAQLAVKQRDLPKAQYGVIIADPEWPDETWSEAGKDRSPENHYTTSSIADIAARPVGGIAAADAVIALWIPMRHLAVGNHVTVLRAWGFEPKTVFIWDKVVAGTGYWARNRAEAVVIATRGTMPAPAMGTQWDDIVTAPKDPVHSRKPDWLHVWFEEFYPGLGKIELNARRARPGWHVWGNEAPEDNEDSQTNATMGNAATASPPEEGGATAGRESSVGAAGGAGAPAVIRQDEPADPAGESLAASPGRSDLVAATPETGTGDLDPGAPGAGEGAGSVEKHDPAALPHSHIPVSQLSSDQQNEIIRAGYALDPFPGLHFLVERTGLPNANAIKQRAKRMKLGDRDRQLAAVSGPRIRTHEPAGAAA